MIFSMHQGGLGFSAKIAAGGGGGGAMPTYVSASASATGGTGAISQAWSTHVADDIGILFVQSANESIATPSGWTAIDQAGIGTAGAAGSTCLAAFWKKATSSSEAAVSIADSGDHTTSVMMVIRGAHLTAPVDVFANSSGSLTAVSLPSVTTTVDNCLIILAAADSLDSGSNPPRFTGWANGALSAVTGRISAGTSNGNGGGFGVAHGGKATAGSTGTSSVTQAFAGNYISMTFAMKPI